MKPGIVSIAAGLVLSVAAASVRADEGHNHDAPVTVSANGPQRLPDGAVFLPKPAQRQIGLRTQVVQEAPLPRSVELSGKVVMDPNAGGRVQALAAGRLESGPGGLPAAGQSVRKGQVLAYVRSAADPLARSSQAAQLAELRASRDLAIKRAARLKELADTVPRKDIEAAESELASIEGRIAAVGGGLAAREALVAPVSGVIATANGVAGQVVDARELLYEIVDPTRVRVEALAYDAELAANVRTAFIPVADGKVELRFVGAARALRDQALPLAFRAEGPALSRLAVGQPVKVVVQTQTTVKGFAVPAGAVVKNPSNQAVVWVKVAPERLEPRVVHTEPLDAATVAVTSGLKAGDRIAVQGATLVNQIR